MPFILKNDDSVVVFDDGCVATFHDGRWEAGSLFDNYELSEQFHVVKDEVEIDILLEAAAEALQESGYKKRMGERY